MAIIEGAVSGNLAEVDSNNQMKVVLSNTAAETGSVRMKTENDAGSITGTAQLKAPKTSLERRLRTGADTVWDEETFNYVAQNTSKHKMSTATMVAGWASGYMTVNSTGALASGNAVVLSTYRSFPIYGNAPVYSDMQVALSAAMQPNVNMDFGFMLPNTAITIPLDGIYFRWNSTGLIGVVNNNGTEVTTSPFTFTPTIGTFYNLGIAINRDTVEFKINDAIAGTLSKPAAAGGVAYSGSLPWGVRQHNTGVVGAAVSLRVQSYNISVGDVTQNRLFASQQSGMGLSSIQGASGHIQGQTANYVNSAAPASATLSNTAAGYTTLGGQFQFAAVAGAETDYALFAYLNPAQTVGITGRNLVIRGLWVDTMNTGAAVATTATWLQWAAAVGSTAVSLATAEAAATRAPRRIALGNQVFAIADAIGKQATRLDVNLDAPIVVEPGTYFHVVLKMPLGTATASQIIRGVVGVNAYWE